MSLRFALAGGLETGSAAFGIEWESITGTVSIETTIVRTSGKAYRYASGANNNSSMVGYSSGGQMARSYGGYFHIVTLPSAATRDILTIANSSNNKVGLRISSSGVLQLMNLEDGTQIGSDFNAVNTGEFYRFELKVDDTTLSATVVEARLYAASDEATLLWNPSGTVDFLAAPNRFALANSNDAALDMVWTDLTCVDWDGTAPNSWMGEGSIGYLRPDSAGGSTQWSRGGTDSGANWSQVEEIPPDNITTYIQSNTSGQVDDFNLEATPAGVASDDVIPWVAWGGQFRISSTAGADPDFVARITAGGNTEESANLAGAAGTTTWRTYQFSPLHVPPLVLVDMPGASTTAWTKSDLDSAQVGVRETVTDTHFVQVSALWLMYWHKPAEVAPEQPPVPEIFAPDESYDENAGHEFSGWQAWQTPEDVFPADESIRQELPQIDDAYDVRYSYKGWSQAPLLADPLMGRVETFFIDATYDVQYNYDGWQQSPMRGDVFALPLPEWTPIDETYAEEHDYNGFVNWQTPEDVFPAEDFQALAEATQIDQTYDVEHDYGGFVSWQTPEDVFPPEDFQPLAESPVIDDTYSVRYSYKGWTQDPLLADFLMGGQSPLVVDNAYDVPGYNYDGWQQAPLRGDVVAPPIAPEATVIDDTYDYVYDYDGWSTEPLSENFFPPFTLEVVDYHSKRPVALLNSTRGDDILHVRAQKSSLNVTRKTKPV